MLCIKNGLVHDAVTEEPKIADILIENGKITAIGSFPEPAGDAQVIDASGLSVYPGFVEAHCHLGVDGYGIGFEGDDVNERGDVVAAHLRGLDAINPMDPTFRQAVEAGVTCVATGPGSANVLGGTFLALKTVGTRVDHMVVKDPIAMKCAFGENPKRCYREEGNCTRMTTAAKLRELLFKASEYMEKKEAAAGDVFRKPAFDMKMEALIPVLKGEIPLKAHAHQANDIFTAIRIAREFGVKLTLEHCTEGHLIAGELAREGFPVAVGPSFGHATKFELRNKTFETPGILADAGCSVSIITDSPVIPQQYLPLCAGLAVKSGMKPFDALKAITINPARHIGIDRRVGSLEPGKDGDLVITDGSPFDLDTQVKYVVVDGTVVVS